MPLYRSWRVGGFLGEMDRQGVPTGAVLFELPDGGLGRAGGAGPPGWRGRFPQVSADLRVRWCSSVLKIEVLAAAIRGQARFLQGRTLVVTGERAEESPGRARYAAFEPHRTATAGGRAPARRVDHWRPIHGWSRAEVWRIIERFAVTPHPAYQLGWGRLSCRACIFGSPNQWATIRAVFPDQFRRIAALEQASGFTIQRSASVVALADRGCPYLRAGTDGVDLYGTEVNGGEFDTLQAFCAEHGLAYRLTYDGYGGEWGPATRLHHADGAEETCSLDRDGGDACVCRDDLARLGVASLGDLEAYLERFDRFRPGPLAIGETAPSSV